MKYVTVLPPLGGLPSRDRVFPYKRSFAPAPEIIIVGILTFMSRKIAFLAYLSLQKAKFLDILSFY